MSTNIYLWAQRWDIPKEAVAELVQSMIQCAPVPADGRDGTEESVSKKLRLRAAQKGIILWRNNVGVMQDETGRVVRYGLANDSAQMNKSIKSSDLVGIGDDGRFVAREVKKPGWVYRGTPRERAQLKYLELVTAKGGDAKFATSEDDI